jgi:hypothetical protein
VVLRWAAFPLLQGFCVAAFPHGAPPLVSDGPGTPGDGEINIATAASHTTGVTQRAVSDVDLNYRWGDTTGCDSTTVALNSRVRI